MLYRYYYTCMSSSFFKSKYEATKKPASKEKIFYYICTNFPTSFLYNFRK